ncbi:hypothetical protein V4F39_19855 [Aquincola sp. MAHUQ-54]|uniref:Uncharacterized protein n=1 Tax=Aquincola agrisoli TaxID=3119538 RepID=A0AAW9QNM1_9BURK
MQDDHPLHSHKHEPRVATTDGGDRTPSGSNYGDYVPPPTRTHAPSAVPDPALPPEVAPDDPDAALIKARRAQQATRDRHGGHMPVEPQSSLATVPDAEAAPADPAAAARVPSSGPDGVARS